MKKGFAPIFLIAILLSLISAVWFGIFLINQPAGESQVATEDNMEKVESTPEPGLSHCAQYHDIGYAKGLYDKDINDQSENIEIPSECKDIHDQAFENGKVERQRQYYHTYDTERRSDLLALGNVIYMYAAENNGEIPSSIESELKEIGIGAGKVDLLEYIEKYHIQKSTNPDLFDPEDGSAESTKYKIKSNPDGRIQLEGKSSLGESIVVYR